VVRFCDQDLTVTAVGTGEDFPQVHDWPPQSGVFFTADHVESYAQVVELGQTVATNLFPQGTNPLGQYVLIGSSPFQVIGVLSGKGLNSRGDDQDNSVWLACDFHGFTDRHCLRMRFSDGDHIRLSSRQEGCAARPDRGAGSGLTRFYT